VANNELDSGGSGGTSNDEDASLSGINLSNFLTDSSSLRGVDFRAASGINVAAVSDAIVGVVGFTLAWAASSFVEALLYAPVQILEWITRSGTDLFGATVGVGITAVEGVWALSLAQFGFGAYLVALLIVLATFWVVDKGIDAAQEVL